MLPPFVDRHARADREDQDRDDERPEIQLAPIAEGVGGIGRALGALLSVQQQDLIAAVDQRMDPLRQHGGRTGDAGRDELGDRDAQIGGKRAIQDDILPDAGGERGQCHSPSGDRRTTGGATGKTPNGRRRSVVRKLMMFM